MSEEEKQKIKKPSEQALLAEYQTCEQTVRMHISRYWVVAGVFMAINTAFLGGAASSIILNDPSTNENIKWLVLLFGIVLIIIILLLIWWSMKVNWLTRVHYHRMQEIESELGLLANLTINWLNNPNEVPRRHKNRINILLKKFPPGKKEKYFVYSMYGVIVCLWVALIVIVFCLN